MASMKNVFLTYVIAGLVAGNSDRESLDVLEGEEVSLQCRFDPVPADSDVTLYWIRNNREGSDNAAIESTSLDTHYRVERFPSLGRYDLRIQNTTYDRDNGNFRCMVKSSGSGTLLHTKKISLTVLLKPSPPRVLPASPAATEGRPVNLTCSSTGGSPPPQVRWFREGESQLLDSVMILGSTREEPTQSILTIQPKREDDNAVFRCTVWNRALGQRQKLESKVQLSVNYFPRVSIENQNPLRIEEGDTAVMSCQVDSKPRVESVKWTREGRYIATTFRHVIPTIHPKDAGLYYCEADNGLGQNGKAELNIIVLHEPRVAVLGLREAAEGDDITVTCEAAANPPPVSYEWSLEGSPRFKQVGQQLHLKSVTAASSGNYTCSVVNVLDPSGAGAKPRRRTGTGTLRLVVRHRPGVAYVDPVAPVGIEGQAVDLVCGSSPAGYPPPAFKWWRVDSPNEILSSEPRLTLSPVRLGSAGEYACQAANELGEGAPVTVRMDVVQEPRIVSGLQERVQRKAGDTGLILSCSAIGRPAPSLAWFKDGKIIDVNDDRLFRITVNDQQQQAAGAGSAATLTNVVSTLRFSGSARTEGGQGVLPSDAGEFTCQFENTVGSTQSAVVLKVEHAPILLPGTSATTTADWGSGAAAAAAVVSSVVSKVAADLGETARLACRMGAFPSPSFSWERGSSHHSNVLGTTSGAAALLRNPDRYAEQPVRQVGESAFESVLEVRAVDESAFGDYLCTAANAMGSATARLSLVKRGRPESPTEVRALEAEANHILLTWAENFDGGFPNRTQFRVQYRELGAAIGEAAEQSCAGSSGSSDPCRLSGLRQHTTYIVRVRAVNPLGESNWSEQVSITTQIDVSHIPSPDSVYYEKSTRSVSFKVGSNYPLSLVAKLEAMLSQAEGSWLHLRSVPLRQRPYKFPVADPGEAEVELENVRVRLCLEANDLLCGAYNEASTVDKIQEADLQSSAGEPWLIPVIIGILVSLVVSLILLVRFCCIRPSAHKKLLKKEELAAARPDLLHSSLQFDNKVGSPEKDPKADIYLQKQELFNSSDARGSLNSQDSLWDVKEDNHHNMADYSRFESDYAHYPQPEEYLGDLNARQQQQHVSLAYLTNNGDQYAVPLKLRSQLEYQEQGRSLNSLGRLKSYQERDGYQDQADTPTHKKVIREIIV